MSGESVDYQIDLAGTSTECAPGSVVCKINRSQVTKTTLGVTTGRKYYIEGQAYIIDKLK